MQPIRRDRRVMDGLEVELGPEQFRQFAASCRVIAGLPLGLGQRSIDLGLVVWFEGAWPGGKVGKFA